MTIDIFIPFWGDPDLLLQAISSVRQQTDGDWVLTVVDDCYPISVAERIADFGDERITYVRNEHNLGITDNYRRCVQLAQHDLVVLFGCDDIMLPNYVKTIKQCAQAFPEADIIQPQVEVIDERGLIVNALRDTVKARLVRPRTSGKPKLLTGQAAAANLMWGNWLYWPSLAFRRQALVEHDFRDGFPIIQDLALVIDMILDGCGLLYVPVVCFRYRRHISSASAASSVDGRRFDGERRYLALAGRLMQKKSWWRAAFQARLRLLSRLDAITVLPQAIKARQSQGVGLLVRHILAWRDPVVTGGSRLKPHTEED